MAAGGAVSGAKGKETAEILRDRKKNADKSVDQ